MSQPPILAFSSKADPKGPAVPVRRDRILNYVWINNFMLGEESPKADEPLCGVPLHYFDEAFENARRYPETEVRLWVDYKFMNALSTFFVQSHLNINAPPNVLLMDLRSIPRYAKNEELDGPLNLNGVYNRADLARFIVLSHVLKIPGVKEAFYADFDVEHVQLDNPVTRSILATRGIALGHAHDHPEIIAPGYIAVRKPAEEELDTHILPRLERALYNQTGVIDSLENYFNDAADNGELTDVPLRPFGWQMPVPAIYTEYGICNPPHNYYDPADLEMD